MQFYIYNMAIVMIYVAEIFRARFLQMFAFFVTALSEGGGPLDPMVLWNQSGESGRRA